MLRVLFVCLGNICRSPMAEGVFDALVRERGLEEQFYIDSAGTASYHIGALPDHRMRQTAERYSIQLTHRARQFSKKDFEDFDYILAMDGSNFMNIKRLDHAHSHGKVLIMRDFDPQKTSLDVPDPYYGDMNGFEEVYHLLWRCNTAFLDYLVREHTLKKL